MKAYDAGAAYTVSLTLMGQDVRHLRDVLRHDLAGYVRQMEAQLRRDRDDRADAWGSRAAGIEAALAHLDRQMGWDARDPDAVEAADD